MAAQLKVAWPLVVLHGRDEKHHYLYAEALVEPVLYDSEQIKSLLADGALVDENAKAKPAEADKAPEGDEKPSGNASLEAWQDYARTHGKTDDDLDGLGRDAVRDLFA